MELKGSKTEANLMEAFAGKPRPETSTPTSPVLPKRGYEQIAGIFLETADDEKSARAFRFLIRNQRQTWQQPRLENYEWTEMYRKFAQEAREEGLTIMNFRRSGGSGGRARERFRLLARVESNTVFARDVEIKWHCRNCGYPQGQNGPELCRPVPIPILL